MMEKFHSSGMKLPLPTDFSGMCVSRYCSIICVAFGFAALWGRLAGLKLVEPPRTPACLPAEV
jgi:hypothetical protein